MNRRAEVYPEHLEDLKKSGLNDETIEKSKVYSIGPTQLQRKIGYSPPHIKDVLVIPYPQKTDLNGINRSHPSQAA